MENVLNHWKNKTQDLKSKIKKTEEINEKNYENIFPLIESIIEEKFKEMKSMHNKSSQNNVMKVTSSLSDFSKLLEGTFEPTPRENKNCEIIADKSNMDYNLVNTNFQEIISKLNKDYNQQFSDISQTIIFNNNTQIPPTDDNNNNLISIFNQNSNQSNLKYKNDNNNDPFKLVVNFQNENNPEDTEKVFENWVQEENLTDFPMYNYDKLLNTTFDLNSNVIDWKNVYYKIFPMIESDEKKLVSKKIFELENPNSNKAKKSIYDNEKLVRYKDLTPLQKIMILYAIFTTGNNPYLVNCILNSYSVSHCIFYSNDEINIITKKLLEELGIEFEANFANINNDIFNYDTKNQRHYLINSQKSDIDSAIFFYEFNNFLYNDTMKKIFNNDENVNNNNNIVKNNDQYKVDSSFDLRNNFSQIQISKNYAYIISKNKYLPEYKKKKIYKELIEFLKKKCELVASFKKKNIAKYNYFTGEINNDNTRMINDINYEEIHRNSNTKLEKNDILRILSQNKNENFSIKKKLNEKLNEKNEYNRINSLSNSMMSQNDETNIKTAKVLSVLNKYNEDNIKKEWSQMRNIWYQNNQRFNPIFKEMETKQTEINKKAEISGGSNVPNTGENKPVEFNMIKNISTNQQ